MLGEKLKIRFSNESDASGTQFAEIAAPWLARRFWRRLRLQSKHNMQHTSWVFTLSLAQHAEYKWGVQQINIKDRVMETNRKTNNVY